MRTPRQALVDLFADIAAPGTLDSVSPRYNIAPMQQVLTIRRLPEDAMASWTTMHWGLIPFWSDDPAIGNRLINARSETLAEKPAFRTSFRRKRCLVIADGFYEWTAQGGGKQPHYFQMRDDRPFGFAGLWDRNEKLDPPIESCTIITTSANTLVAAYHTRMPVILRPEAYAFWLDPDRQETANLSDLLVPCAPDLLQVQPVSRRVNNPKNDDAACLEPA